ncbi:MAG: methionyl-tRNA formyltransferase [Anaerolineales bacterium]|nr:methionyl-tRNA formyltransferase [Anaerolineales bacterium]
MKTRIVFMGSPNFAVPTLRALAEKYTLIGVITQPDRPAGRGRKLSPPPIKTLADKLGLPTIQPKRLNQPEAMEQLRVWKPDLIIVAAFGQILRSEALDLAPQGCINVHASLLPRWRGAAPIQAAILHGESETGITIMRMDVGLDTGPILSQRSESILPRDTAGSLQERLASLGARALIDTLPGYLNGEIKPRSQDDTLATYAPMLAKADGELDFQRTALELERQVRAFNPWPGAFAQWKNGALKIHRAIVIPASETLHPVAPGERVVHGKIPAIGTGCDLLGLEEVQPAGKKAMTGEAFLQGARDWTT